MKQKQEKFSASKKNIVDNGCIPFFPPRNQFINSLSTDGAGGFSVLSTWISRVEILDYLSTGCVYFGNVSVDRAKIVLQYLHSDRNYSNFWVNGKQPMCLANSWETASSRDGAVLPGVVTTAARGNPFPMPLAIVTKSKMNQEMDKSNAQKQTSKRTHRRNMLSRQGSTASTGLRRNHHQFE